MLNSKRVSVSDQLYVLFGDTDAYFSVPEGASQPAQTQRVVAFNAPEKEARGPGAKPAKPKKIKPLPPAQASGMTSADLTACRNCLKKLLDSKHAPLFLNPVDPVRDKAPNYFNIINNPMDLSTLGNKLNSGMYADRFAFKTDFELIIANAKRYTPDPKAWVHTEAIALEHVFNQQWNRITKTLEQAAAKQAKAAQGATSESTVQQSDERSPPTVQPNGHAAPPSVAMPPPPASISLTKKQPSVEAPATPVTPKPGGTSVKLKLKPPKLVGTPKASVESPAPPPSTPKPPPTTPKPPPTTSKLPPSTPKPPPATPKRSKQTSASPRKEAEHERPPKKKATVPASSVDDELLAMIGDSEANGHAAKPAMSPSSGEGLLQRSSPLVSVKKSKAAAASPATTSLAGRSEFPASPSPAPSKATPPASKTKKPSAESDPIGASLGEPINVKRCKNLLQTVKKLPEAIFFLRPVDPILDGAPT